MAYEHRRKHATHWRSAVLAAAALLACQGGSDEPPSRPGADSAAAVDPTIATSLDTGAVSAPGVPAGALRAVLLVVTAFDEEGILTAPLETAPPGVYATGDTLWADASAVAAAAADSAAPEMASVGGHLVLGGAPSTIPARVHGGVVYAPAEQVALRHGGFLYLHPPPDPGVRQRSGTLWPRAKLCEWWARGQRKGAAVEGALEHGLLEACPPGS